MMHVVEVSQASVAVRISDGCLCVSSGEETLGKVPVAEIGALLLSSPHATCSVTALATLASQGTPVIVCDPSMRPAGMMLPFREHHEIASRIAAQATAKLPVRKQLWKSLVRSKIAGQAAVLRDTKGSDFGLTRAIQRVRSGDPDNVEGRAARRYWTKLFGPAFRRRRGQGLTNKMLDYAYAVLRAGVTRSICAAGLHPSIGIHHHNRSNAFVLADDLIEPFRPVVDQLVFAAIPDFSGEKELTPSIKRRLAYCLENTLPMNGEMRKVRDALGRSASSLAKVFLGETKTILLPWIG
jgi:CRISPR-associated protein Cas1